MKAELAAGDESDSIEALISICSDNHLRESRDREREMGVLSLCALSATTAAIPSSGGFRSQ